MAKYRIRLPYYSQGELVPAGEIIDIPDDRPKSKYWDPVDPPSEEDKPKKRKGKAEAAEGSRPSDMDPSEQ